MAFFLTFQILFQLFNWQVPIYLVSLIPQILNTLPYCSWNPTLLIQWYNPYFQRQVELVRKTPPSGAPRVAPYLAQVLDEWWLFWRLPVPVARDSDSCVRPSGTDLPLKILGVFFGTFVSVSLTFQLASRQLWVWHDSSGPFVCLLEQQLRKGRRDPSCSAGF